MREGARRDGISRGLLFERNCTVPSKEDAGMGEQSEESQRFRGGLQLETKAESYEQPHRPEGELSNFLSRLLFYFERVTCAVTEY